MMRDFIIVEENGAIVKYIRAEEPKHKPKRTKAKPAVKVSTAKKLQQCGYVVIKCHNMTKEEIEAKIKEVKNVKQITEFDNLVDLFSRDWFSEPQQKKSACSTNCI